NPAKQLRIDKQVGSLEAGKDADFAIWSGHPLSTTSICLQTWIDGKQYFEREAAKRRSEARNTERLALIAKAKKLASGSADDKDGDEKAKARFFFRTLEERQNHLCVDCCMERSLSWQN
ncbi:MAG: amidohydrolase family protein, partial [Verrucomicrobiaceae bacterium]|nr:amidohydrolase family protein [Verrucomicrobiaceae bacterium]